MTEQRAGRPPSKARGWIFGTLGVLGLVPVLVLTGFLLAHFEGAQPGVRSAVVALPLVYIALMGWGVLRVVFRTRVVEGRRRPATPTQLASGYLFATLLAGLALIILLAASGGYMEGITHPIAPWLLMGVMALSGWGTVVYYRRLDEAALEAHKFAWLWGAQTGLFLAACLAILLWTRGDETGSTVDGIFLALVGAFIGYGVAWGFWWLRKR